LKASEVRPARPIVPSAASLARGHRQAVLLHQADLQLLGAVGPLVGAVVEEVDDAGARFAHRMARDVARIGGRRVGHAADAGEHVELLDHAVDRVDVAQDGAVLGHRRQAALGHGERDQDLVVGPAAQANQADLVVLRLQFAGALIKGRDLAAALEIVEAAVELRQRAQAKALAGLGDVAEPQARAQGVADDAQRPAREALEDVVERAEAQAVGIDEQRAVGRHQAVEMELGRKAQPELAGLDADQLHGPKIGGQLDGEIGDQVEFSPGSRFQ
jgi:hypothetical protein